MPSVTRHRRLGAALLVLASILDRSNAHRPQLVKQDGSRKLLQTNAWLQEHFPSPDSDACRATQSHRLCDPDGVLSLDGLARLDEYLQAKKYVKSTDACLVLVGDQKTREENDEAEGLEVQMGVAVVQKMDLTPFSATNKDDREDRAAETFARYVHDKWGVGVETESCGGAGVLLFLSMGDRTVYISRGAALEGTLTDRRLDQIIDSMKGYLRSEEYEEAISKALHDMLSYIESGPPTKWENFFHIFVSWIFPVGWIVAVLGSVVKRVWLDSRRSREYARVRSQLSEIDRARAEALQGQYNCTSCPICLEDFTPPSTEGGVTTIGSDGQPIKLLRCGHCMDETCWADWVSSGRGTITKCPICMQDIGGADDNSNNNHRRQQDQPRRRDANNNNPHQPNYNFDNVNDANNVHNHDEDRILRQYRQERRFRLGRLGYRYPQIVRPAQIQRWSQPTYDGTLVRDPSFVQSNPTLMRPASQGGSRMGSGGFGGSSSGGGRGGRW